MAAIKANDGQMVTDVMIDGWCEALDRDEWPDGWHNVGDVVAGRPPAAETMAVLSLKLPAGKKKAIEREAKSEGISTSAFARRALEDRLIALGA